MTEDTGKIGDEGGREVVPQFVHFAWSGRTHPAFKGNSSLVELGVLQGLPKYLVPRSSFFFALLISRVRRNGVKAVVAS